MGFRFRGMARFTVRVLVVAFEDQRVLEIQRHAPKRRASGGCSVLGTASGNTKNKARILSVGIKGLGPRVGPYS